MAVPWSQTCWISLLRSSRCTKTLGRSLGTMTATSSQGASRFPPPSRLGASTGNGKSPPSSASERGSRPQGRTPLPSLIPSYVLRTKLTWLLALSPKKIKTIAPPPSTAAKAKDPIGHITALQIAELDPTGARTRLFSRENPDGARVGDILLVRQRNGDPFAGVCLSIRRRGVDTGILLRNRLIGTSVEMWFKLYSPNVEGVELVQKTAKRARRARLYYLR